MSVVRMPVDSQLYFASYNLKMPMSIRNTLQFFRSALVEWSEKSIINSYFCASVLNQFHSYVMFTMSVILM